MNEANRYSAKEAAALIAAGKLTAVKLAEDCLARVEAREEAVQAWAYIDPKQVLAEARARDAEPPRSPLHGVPVAIKDIIDTGDMPTEYGSPIYAGHRPRADAACVALLRNAGAVIMGKTVTAEFAMSHPGKTRNPAQHGAHAGRLLERLRRRGRGLDVAACARDANRRIGAAAGRRTAASWASSRRSMRSIPRASSPIPRPTIPSA
jgi:hypothetical protein